MKNRLFYVFGVGTEAFYTDKEKEINDNIREAEEQLSKFTKSRPKPKYHEDESGEIILLNKSNIDAWEEINSDICKAYKDKIKVAKENLRNEIENNKNIIRTLRDDAVLNKRGEVGLTKRVTIPDGSLARVLGLKSGTGNFNPEVCIVTICYYDIMYSLIKYGFMYHGYKYKFFTSSAGQIRQHKIVCVREDVLTEDKWNTLMAGLSIDEINCKGGMNINKVLSYTSLCNSSTTPYLDFDIDRCIVVDDLQKQVEGEADYIDCLSYKITRRTASLPVEMNDGCGLVLPSVSRKNFVIRMPFFKGLCCPFDYLRFIEEHKCSSIVTDIYGKTWDLINDNIQIVFTKSQFKLWKMYDSWEDYKTRFKKYNCEAGIGNVDDESPEYSATTSYQMIQTLRNLTEDDIRELGKNNYEEILSLGRSKCENKLHYGDKDRLLKILGAYDVDKCRSWYQRCLNLYPELLEDSYTRTQISDLKNSLEKDLWSAKFKLHSQYTFTVPDLYAFCEKWLLGIENPLGLLKANEVSCNLFEHGKKLDVLRSPHLYREHCVCDNNIQGDWFTTNACYVSLNDFNQYIRAEDWDGDHVFVTDNGVLVSASIEACKDIKPVYYEMKKGDSSIITPDSLYQGMRAAFSYGKIGIYSNAITKIWNTPVDKENWELSPEAMAVVKWLMCESNFSIDAAKTLFMIDRQGATDTTYGDIPLNIIPKYTKAKVPRFFEFAKGKELYQVEPHNNSPVNLIRKVYPKLKMNYCLYDSKRLYTYEMLMHNKNIKVSDEVITAYRQVRSMKFKKDEENGVSNYELVVADCRDKIFNSSDCSKVEIVDMIIKSIFDKKSPDYTSKKKMFWEMFGDIVYDNVKNNIETIKRLREGRCVDCGELFKRTTSMQCRCKKCQAQYRKMVKNNAARNSMRKARSKMLDTFNSEQTA